MRARNPSRGDGRIATGTLPYAGAWMRSGSGGHNV
jgi:hypothetical protein